MTGHILGESVCRLLKIGLTDDVVAVEDRACLVPGDAHRHPLRHTGADQVTDNSAAEVVEELLG
jgi:hypothetical protein